MNDPLIQPIRESYDHIADEYARRIFHELDNKPLDRELLNRFAADIKGRGPACDIGCGPGHVARYLHDAGANVFGLDLSPNMVEQARRLNPGISFQQGDMLALNLESGSLAGITAFYAIVNLGEESLPLAFREMARVLEPGGLLLLAFHIGDHVMQVNDMWGRPVSLDFHYFQPSSVMQHMQAAGLAIEDTIEREPYAPDVEHQSRRAYIFARKPGTPVINLPRR